MQPWRALPLQTVRGKIRVSSRVRGRVAPAKAALWSAHQPVSDTAFNQIQGVKLNPRGRVRCGALRSALASIRILRESALQALAAMQRGVRCDASRDEVDAYVR